MTRDITNSNFDDSFPDIELKLKLAEFIAIDAEFSGISSDSPLKNSLFDSSEDRYVVVRDNIKDFVIVQFGLTAFQFMRDKNEYMGTSYVFHILKMGDDVFTLQYEAVDFLSSHGFDFVKLMSEGIGYLNGSEEKLLLDELDSICDSSPIHLGVDHNSEIWIENECARVSDWLNTANENDLLLLLNSVDEKNKVECCLLAKSIEHTFTTASVIKDNHGKMLVKKVHPKENQCQIQEAGKTFKDELIKSSIGFSRLFKLLTSLKKPIVGHNPLLDLMLMYHQFHEPLPCKYQEFKKNLHSLFPTIYDTKYISYELREIVDRELVWESNELSLLYQYFKSGHGFNLAMHTPSITCSHADLSNVGLKNDAIFHEAGWDSFYTGFCFIRLMHYFATKRILNCGMISKPLVSQQLLFSVQSYKNRVNVARANINHLCLDGPDPKSKRPRWLLVTSTTKNTEFELEELLNLLPINYRSMDVKVLSKNRAILALNSHSTAREVFSAFIDFHDWKVVTYNPIVHNLLIQKLQWFAVASCVSLGTWKIWKMLSK